MMGTILMVAAVLLAIFNWLAVEKEWKPVEYFTKPGVMVALLAWFLITGEGFKALSWFTLGLLFSLSGDVLLMIPRNLFLGGLFSFLLAHLAYIVGFNPSLPPLTWFAALLVIILSLVIWQIYRRLSAGLEVKGVPGLKVPILVYASVISLMTLSALLTLTRPEWKTGHALLAGSGAISFMVSDTLLAWDRFVAPLPHGRLATMVTYHLGQAGIVFAAALHVL